MAHVDYFQLGIKEKVPVAGCVLWNEDLEMDGG